MTLRVSKAEIPIQLRESMIEQFGAVAEPVEVTWHNPSVAQAALQFGAQVGAWDAADASLKTFAHMAVAAQVAAAGAWTSTTSPHRTRISTWRRRARCRAGAS